MKQVKGERQSRRDALAAEAERYYSGKDAAYWRSRFAEAVDGKKGTEPLRVLGITCRYTTVLQHSMAELQEAVNAWKSLGGGGWGGAEMRVAIEPDDQSLECPVLESIAGFKPDLIVLISRMRHENSMIPASVPFLCWDQDNLPCMREPAATASLNELTYVAGHGALFGALYLKWPLRNCIFCHPTGMMHRYGRRGAGTGEESHYQSDVSYVSHASGSAEQLRDTLGCCWEGATNAFAVFRAACDEVIASARGGRRWDFWGLRKLIENTSSVRGTALSELMRNELLANLTLIADRVFRHETLGWAARWCESRGKRMRLWGNGWENHATLGKYAAGAALPGDQAQAVFRASTLNLQIIETGVLHSRVLDGWAAGGFFLIRQACRPEDEETTLKLWRIGELTMGEGIETVADVESRGSEELRTLWQGVGNDFREFDREAVFPGFKIWQSLPPAQVLIPGLERIVFLDEAGFGALADRYVGDEAARRRYWRVFAGCWSRG